MYTQQIPGITAFTPVTQLNVDQSPRISGLGATSVQENPVNNILDTATNFIKDNPLPVLGLLAFLVLRK